MIEPEENCEKDGEGDSQEDFSHRDFPEGNEPRTIDRRTECSAGRKFLEIDIFHVSNVHEPREEYDRQWRSIILDEFSNMSVKQLRLANNAAEISTCRHE